ncbi:MAG: SO_0444 family Cu/Zn efflux transporter [Phycisphaerae bacterium]|nr:SO_0444 family Cu/Zn efflux transporter [Phycisphaerae bacterium]
MIKYLTDIGTEFWTALTVMSPYLLFGFLVAGIMSVFISPKLVETHLGGRGIWPVIKASLFGVPLPLCSCGVIPVTVSLKKHGASRGASISFLLSTPQTGIDSIFVTYGMLGPVFAIFRPLIAFATGIIGGVAVESFAPTPRTTDVQPQADDNKSKGECQDSCCKKTQEGKIVRLLKYGFLTLPKDVGGAMLGGLVIAALIGVFVPGDFILEGVETLGTFGTMLVMMALGIPVYVCATASVPLAAVMIAKGISPGAALVFLMTGPATNAAAFATIWKIMGSRTAIIYILTVIGCALGSGLFLDLIFPTLAVEIPHIHEMPPSVLGHISAILLLTILLKGIYEKSRNQKNAGSANS